MANARTLSDEQKEAAKFLDRDFSQCFQQMRHYDGQIVGICKFAFTGYIAVAGAAIALYKYGVEKSVDYRMPAAVVLCLAGLFGFMLLGLVVRNRVYFVLVARYINEHRRHFLKDKPLGFANESRMYTNPTQPPYFSWLSSQAWLMYFLALLNTALVTIAAVIGLRSGSLRWSCVLVAIVVLVGQLLPAITYLRTRDEKSPSAAVWGK